jgi:sarcosine oxidase
MAKTYDVIIAGGGLLGLSTAWALAKAGKEVLVLDANEEHHTKGSSHGHTRIYRQLDSETPVFHQTAADSLKMMLELEKVSGDIVKPMPAVFIYDRDSKSQRKAIQDAESSGYKLEEITAIEAANYGLRINDGEVGYIDRNAATINPHNILAALHAEIKSLGGEVKFKAPLAAWESSESGVKIISEGTEITAQQLVIAAGGWTPEVLRRGNANPKVTECLAEAMRLERIPVFYFDCPDQIADVIPARVTDAMEIDPYAMPEIGHDGRRMFKMGVHTGRKVRSPAEVERTISDEEKEEAVKNMEMLTGKKLKLKDAIVCLYAIANDNELPIIDSIPSTHDRVFAAVYGGGILAKHALAFGEALSDMMQGKKPDYDMREFSATRLTAQLRINADASERHRE